MNDKKKEDNLLNDITIAMGQSEIVQRHGEAASQKFQAYIGKRYDSQGKEIVHKGRSLKEINNYKVNPEYAKQNIKQQAGFSAELLEESNKNKEAILDGSKIRRRTTDGIGKTNDTQYDLVDVDSQGNISNPTQMKFLGVDKKGRYNVIEKLVKDETWDRYDELIEVPKDQYHNAFKYAIDKSDDLLNQAKRLREEGKIELAQKKEKEALRYRQASSRISPSTVTEGDALLARQNPKLYLAKEMIKDADKAGREAAKNVGVVAFAVSSGTNICQLINGDITLDEAVINVTKDTAKAGLTAYGYSSAGTTIKSLMHSSQSDVIRKLGNTNLPLQVLGTSKKVVHVMKAYLNSEITEFEACSQLTQDGINTLAASYGAAVGTILLPGIGTAVGSMMGYMISSMIYDSCLQIFYDADLSYENYLKTKEICEYARQEMSTQRRKYEELVNQFIQDRQIVINDSLSVIMNSIDKYDISNFDDAIYNLAEEFGHALQFKNFDEFDEFMLDENMALKF